MRVLIFGASGMLGHKLYQRLRAEFDVFATVRSGFESIERFGIFDKYSIIENVDVSDTASIRRTVETVKPDCVINAVGIIKQVPGGKEVIQNLLVNAVFPHRLAELSAEHGFRIITISTDCVFDGKRGNYSEDDIPDARDLYGMSKFLGELNDNANALTLRTSMIGRELGTCHSLVEWFLSNSGKTINGYINAIYSGFPTVVLTGIIADLIARQPPLTGLFHIASDPINKFDLLSLINKYFDAGVEIESFNDFVIDRSLDSSKFMAATGFDSPSWNEMIAQMAADAALYDSWNKK